MKPSVFITIIATIASTINVSAKVLFVDLNSTNATPPYTNWVTAATNIQDAVDVAQPGDTVLVTNGVYAAGSRGVLGLLTINRLVIDKAITVQSFNGPQETLIDGARTFRCAYLGTNAILSGFTLKNGYTAADEGGGVWSKSSGVATNCVFTGNLADGSVNGGGRGIAHSTTAH